MTVHPYRPQTSDALGQWFETMMLHAYCENMALTEIHFQSGAYTRLARWLGVDEPLSARRPDPVPGCPEPFIANFAPDPLPTVRVGSSFMIQTPFGLVTIVEAWP